MPSGLEKDLAAAAPKPSRSMDMGRVWLRGLHLRRRRQISMAALSGAAIVVATTTVVWLQGFDGDGAPRPAVAPTMTAEDPEQRLIELRNEIRSQVAELRERRARLVETRRQLMEDAVSLQDAGQDSEVRQLEGRIDALDEKLADLSREIDEARARLSAIDARLLQEGRRTGEVEPDPSAEPSPTETPEAEPELIDDGVVSIRPKRVRPGDTMTIVIRNPPGFYGLGWYLDRQDESEWTYIGGFRAGPPGQWKDHAFNRFYFLPRWRNVGLEDIGFAGNDSIDLKVPRLEPGTYRIAGSFLVKREDEWHVDVFEVIEP